MQVVPWTRKALTRRNLWFVLRVLSPLLIWGFLLVWTSMALQHP